MNIAFPYSKSSRVLIEAFVLALGITFPVTASTFNPSPLFEQVNKYQTTIETNGDPADIYYPDTLESNNFPVALFLQGALVDKADYANFASTVASYGFVVIVPNHFQSFPQFGLEGLLPEVSQIDDVLNYIEAENSNSTSPLERIIDTNNLALLGHSWGGAVGLSAIGNYCIPLVCNEAEFNLPEETVAGIFYGTFLQDFNTGEFVAIDNDSIPLGLISGSRDGVATPEEVRASYELIQNPPKALITVEGANHYGITNEDNLRDPLRPTLEQDIANETIARWSGLFLRASIFDDRDAFDYVYNTGYLQDENVTVISQTKSVPEPIATIGLLTLSVFACARKKNRKKGNFFVGR